MVKFREFFSSSINSFMKKSALEEQAGVAINARKSGMVLLGFSIAAFAFGTAKGQVLALSYDFNTPASEAASTWNQEPREVSSGLAVGLGFYSKPVFSRSSPLRFGVELGRQSLKVGVPGSQGSNTSYSLFNVLGSADRCVVGGSKLNLSAGVAMGLSFMNDSRPCNEPFCNFPESVVMVAPRIKVAVRVSDNVSAYLDTRYSGFLNDRESTYPYKSGVVLALGIEFFGGSGGNKGEDF